MYRTWLNRLTTAAVIAGSLALLPSVASAAKPISGKTVTIIQTRTINDDVYAAGQKIVVNGRINGNLIAAAGAVRVNGTVTGSVISAGGSVRISGHVGKDVTVASGKITIDRGARVGRDLLSFAGSTEVNGQIGRNAQIVSGSIKLGPQATIGGFLKYWGDNNAKIAPGAVVRGTVTHEHGQGFNALSGTQFPFGAFSFILWIRTLVGLFVLGLVFIWLAPVFARRTSETLAATPGASIGWGVLGLIGIPILAVLIFILGLFVGGWWLSLMLLALYWIALALGMIVTGLFVGQWLLVRSGRPIASLWLALLVGVVLLLLVSIVPILGGIVMFLALLLGLGALLLTGLRSSRSSRGEVVAGAR